MSDTQLGRRPGWNDAGVAAEYADELVTSHGARSEIEDELMRHGERARACLPEPLPRCPEFG